MICPPKIEKSLRQQAFAFAGREIFSFDRANQVQFVPPAFRLEQTKFGSQRRLLDWNKPSLVYSAGFTGRAIQFHLERIGFRLEQTKFRLFRRLYNKSAGFPGGAIQFHLERISFRSERRLYNRSKYFTGRANQV
jgi:hypothetical protein